MATLTEDTSSVHTRYASLEGKNALISGGTTGNGRAIAALLSAYGANVFIFGRHEPDLHEALRELGAARSKTHGITADQSRAEEIERVFSTFDREFEGIDILVNNAAIDGGALTEGDEYKWRYSIETNLLGYIDCTRRAIERMKRRGGGHIVNIGSMVASHHNAGESLYVAAKSGIHGFSRALRKEIAAHNIKVSLIEPGLVGTDFLSATELASQQTQHAEERRRAMLKPQNVAVAVHYVLTQPGRSTISLLELEPLNPE